ncbi:hypothetical protein [Petropleomorpha daqingensis]|uniref:Lipoprotein LprG n=1 Tax=Petropleomorpha daqingensis TaxID=2026353 RepID=A0A853CI85_9ACTN|nr:hypothetical protein [Petropleomorpha daqingensis]NYJ07227.1 hypothetical protein [Petropleomorpha daqingensis]
MSRTTLLAKGTIATAIAASAVFGLGACSSDSGTSAAASTTSSSSGHTAPEPTATVAAVPGGTTSVALDQGFVAALTQLGLTPGTVGNAALDGTTVTFPITGGTVTLYDKTTGYRPYVQGVLLHEGSGLSLAAGGTTVQLTNFTVDPGNPARVFGDVTVNGQLAAPSAPIFDLNGSTLEPITMNSDGSAVLSGTTVTISPEAAQLLDQTFSTDAVKGGLVVGISTITVQTK